MKIIAVIEDTGERRVPLAGEVYTHDHSVRDGIASKYLYTHAQETGEYAILRITEAPDLEQPLALRERIELIHLRRFRENVRLAQIAIGSSDAEDPDALIAEAEDLSIRLANMSMALGDAVDAYDNVAAPVMESTAVNPKTSNPQCCAYHAFGGALESPCTISPAPKADPFATEESI